MSALFNSSCGSSKRATKATDNSEEQHQRQEVEHKKEATEQATTKTEIVEHEGETDCYWIVYDTDKPNNQETGRPPVLAEGGSLHQSKGRSRHDDRSETKQETKTTVETKSEGSKTVEATIEESRDTDTGVDLRGIVIAGIVGMLIAVLYLRIRNRN